MSEYPISMQDILDTVGEWHGHEGIEAVQNRLLAIFCAYAHIHLNSPNPDYPSHDLNSLRVAVEAAFQLGRAVGRAPGPVNY